MLGRLVLIAISFTLSVTAFPASSKSEGTPDRYVLWKIVHDQCVPHQQSNRDPFPCNYVAASEGTDRGYAVLKDRVGATQFLLIPTRQISGIESPALLEPEAPNYWNAAWNARRFLFGQAHRELPRDFLSLAINSSVDRSQDQLHIHIDCVRADVRELLAQNADAIGETWSELAFDLAGRRYRAMRVEKPDLQDTDAFKLLAAGAAAQEMGNETLVVVGARFGNGKDGFILLEDRANPAAGDLAHGEDLQDHSCALLGANL